MQGFGAFPRVFPKKAKISSTLRSGNFLKKPELRLSDPSTKLVRSNKRGVKKYTPGHLEGNGIPRLALIAIIFRSSGHHVPEKWWIFLKSTKPCGWITRKPLL